MVEIANCIVLLFLEQTGGIHLRSTIIVEVSAVRGGGDVMARTMHVKLSYLLLSWRYTYILAEAVELLSPHLVIRRVH